MPGGGLGGCCSTGGGFAKCGGGPFGNGVVVVPVLSVVVVSE